jgi:hypothetical protein
MKKFVYENSVAQQRNVICYSFHPDLLDATEEELKEFLQVLCSHFPKTSDGKGGYMPMLSERVVDSWNSAYSNVYRLIQEKKAVSQHRQIIATSVLTVVILALTLAWSIYHTEPTGDPLATKPSQQTTSSTNTDNPSSKTPQNANRK